MALFLSFVGNQPSAVAVAYKTWRWQERADGHQVVLLSTPQTEEAADRLRRWIRDVSHADCHIIRIAPGTSHHTALPTAMQAVRDLLAQDTGGTEVVYLADPGLKSSVAMVARELPDHATILHADADQLHACRMEAAGEQWQAFPLQDLGTKALLDLYGLRRERTDRTLPDLLTRCLSGQGMTLPDSLIRNLRFSGKSSVPTLHLAYEARGQLFGVVVIVGSGADERLQSVRDIRRMSVELQGLRPRLTIISEVKRILARARTYGIAAIEGQTGAGLQEWLARQAPPPGRAVSRAERPTSAVATAFTRAGAQGDPDVYGTGGEGSPLVVCLGTDPSSTLLAICTHRPQVCHVLYDRETPDVVLLTDRLKVVADRLPIGRLVVAPTDLMGRGVRERLSEMAGNEKALAVNITPGTKAQGRALAQMRGTELWSLNTRMGEAQCLTDPTRRGIPMAAPPVLLQAQVVGGDLLSEGVAETDPGEFWTLTLRLLAAYARETPPNRSFALDSIEWKHGAIRRQGGQYEAQFGKQRARGNFRNVEGGFWLEEVVAKAFVLAASDEVRTGIRWNWPHGLRAITEDGPTFKDDLDIAVRIGFRYFGVSCKSSDRTLDKNIREAEAVAGACLGRFTIPVLAIPRLSDEAVTTSLLAKNGAILLNMDTLADSDRLREYLNRAVDSRRTVQAD